MDQLWSHLQRHHYVMGWRRGDEKFHDISDALARQQFKETDDAMRVYPKKANG